MRASRPPTTRKNTPKRKESKRPSSSRLLRQSTVSRWGNSLGVRIPQEAVDQLNLTAGVRVSLELHDDSITIRLVRQRKIWTESELLMGVSPELVGGEIDWGLPVGREVW